MRTLDSKRTKIVATISDKNCEAEFLKTLYESGMDVVRINSAHLNKEGVERIVANVRMISDKIAILPVTILAITLPGCDLGWT